MLLQRIIQTKYHNSPFPHFHWLTIPHFPHFATSAGVINPRVLGGAGNWYTPGTLSKEGVFTDITPPPGASTTPDPTSVNPAHANHQIDPRPWRGRGGAGNFTLDKPVEPEALELEERHAAQEVQEEVRREVEVGLKRPESVYLAPTTLKKDKS